MSQGTLKWLRLATPGLIIVFFFSIFGTITGLWAAQIPTNLKDALASANVVIPAGIYYLLPFRTWANKRYFDSVSENLRSRMVHASGLKDEPNVFTWNSLRGVFWHLVDSDQSLSKKASLAYFNGYVWTTCADVRVISYVYAFLAGFCCWAGLKELVCAALLSLFAALASYFGSAVATRRQRMIGNEQIDIIALYYQDELRSSLKKSARPQIMQEIEDTCKALEENANALDYWFFWGKRLNRFAQGVRLRGSIGTKVAAAD